MLGAKSGRVYQIIRAVRALCTNLSITLAVFEKRKMATKRPAKSPENEVAAVSGGE